MRGREGSERRRATALLTATGAALLATAGLAAGAALTVQSRSFPVASGETRQGIATCGPGRTAVSGGFHAPLTEQGPAMTALDSTREGTRQWRLRARNPGQNGTATAYVYCAQSNPALVTKSALFTIPGGSTGAGDARCESGQEAVSGGFDAPDANAYPLTSRRTDRRTWRVRFYNPGTQPRQFRAFAYCDQGGPGLVSRAKTVTLSQTDRFQQSVLAQCSSTEDLRSGGLTVEFSRAVDPIDTDDIGIVHVSRRWGERRWQVTALAVIGHPKLTAYAYCA